MQKLQSALEWAAGLLLFGLLVIGVLQVASRYTGLFFVPWTEEMARLTFVWLVWIGAAAGVLRGSHIRFAFIVARLPDRPRRIIEIAVQTGAAIFLIVLIYFGYEVVRVESSSSFLTVNLSVKYAYLSAVVGSALMLVGVVGGLRIRRGNQLQR